MCTAITFKTKDFYFGRTLDLECSFFENVIITPRNYRFEFSNHYSTASHYSIIGIGIVQDNYPLYYDAVNEEGLCIAALNFPNNAVYNSTIHDRINLATFEIIPYLLCDCSSVDDVVELINKINITSTEFSNKFTPSPLHWIVADKNKAITIEPLEGGIRVYNNDVGVLTNNPTFDIQIHSLNNYLNLSPFEPNYRFADGIKLNKYSRGMGAIGLPGDVSSNSRFVRACFTKLNSICENDENSSVGQFFHILGGVEQISGQVRLDGGELEKTVYTSCCNTEQMIYYYTTYCNHRINAVKLYNEDIDSNKLISFNMNSEESIKYQN